MTTILFQRKIMHAFTEINTFDDLNKRREAYLVLSKRLARAHNRAQCRADDIILKNRQRPLTEQFGDNQLARQVLAVRLNDPIRTTLAFSADLAQTMSLR